MILTTLILLIAAAGADGAPAGKLPLRVVGASEDLVSDGDRLAAWDAAGGGASEVFDATSGTTRTVPWPERCDGTRGVGAGRLLLTCRDADGFSEAGVHDLATGAFLRVRLPDGLRTFDRESGGASFGRIGRTWLTGEFGQTTRDGVRHGLYLNWRTGAVRVYEDLTSRFQELPRTDQYADLDADALARPLCRALRPASTRHHGILQVVGRRALRTANEGLRVDTCGGRRIVITTCGLPETYDCGLRQLGSRWAVWIQRDRAWAFDLRSGRRFVTRRLPRDPTFAYQSDVAHVRGALFVQAGRRILRATLPPAT